MSIATLFAASSTFESARQVAVLHADHPARRMHGHSFTAKVRVALEPGWAPWPGGEVSELTRLLGACTAQLDYRHLNELLPVPTDENLARWVRDQLQVSVPGLEQVGIQSTSDQGVDLDANDQDRKSVV